MRVWMICSLTVLAGLYATAAYSQTVSILNLSFPGTAIEVGNIVKISIAGAAPFSAVSVVQNGGTPFVWGTTTDSSGSWSTTATEGTANVGSYNQVWYVNGLALTPANLNSTFYPVAPALPNFDVYASYAGSTQPPASTVINTCGASGGTTAWAWSPVSYTTVSTYTSSDITTSAGNWNSAQSRLSLSSGSTQLDVEVYDGTLPIGTLATTATYSQGCDATCYGTYDNCTGVCLNSSAMYYANMQLDPSQINNLAGAFSISNDTFAKVVISHEFGHVLRLGHSFASDGKCSEVGAIMYPFADIEYLCGVVAPTSQDANAINSLYPGTLPFCTPGYNLCSTLTACE